MFRSTLAPSVSEWHALRHIIITNVCEDWEPFASTVPQGEAHVDSPNEGTRNRRSRTLR
jgi:hypothetical protein